MSAVSARSVRQTEGLESVRALQWVLYRSAKQDSVRRFHALFDKVTRSDVLWRAWSDVRANRGAPGVDGVSVDAIEQSGVSGVRAFLDALAADLRAGTYRPAPLRRVHIPKPGRPGATRPLGIPTVRDRIAMAAAKVVLEPVFEADFAPCSFGFRPGRSAHQALEAIRVTANRDGEWVLDADITACFDSIDHEVLMGLMAQRICDRAMLKLLRCWLRAGVLEGGVLADSVTGTPQGSPISPLLANVTLHYLDREWQRIGRRFGVLVRYCDDFVVVCRSRQRAEEAYRRVAMILSVLGLQLNPEKTRIVCLTEGRAGFDFLGFHLRKVEHWKWKRHWYLQRWPSNRAMKTVRAKIRAVTQRRFVGLALSTVVARLNRIVRGWAAYFRYGNSSRKFSLIDSYLHERLAIWTSIKHARRGRNWGTRYDGDWFRRLGVYRLTGTVRHGTAQAWR